MIDYVKILLKDIDNEFLVNSKYLNFKIEVDEKTGEVSTKKIAEYHFCKIAIYDSGLTMFTGSIHKLYNSLKGIYAPNYEGEKDRCYKGFNGNLFTIDEVIQIRTHLSTLFNCKPQQMIFQNIEFGINTTPGFNPLLFIKGLLYQNGKSFEFKYDKHFAQTIHQRYYLKIYNKSIQYKISQNTLRIELKIIKTEELKPTGIKTFKDINNRTLNKAKDLLLKRFNNVVYYDKTIEKENLTKRQKETLQRYSNPHYWIDELLPKNRDKHKKKLKSFIQEYSNNLHQQLRTEIEQKNELINRVNGVIINLFTKVSNRVIINSSSIELIITQKEKKNCVVTGISLEHEKQTSKYIKTSTFRHLKKNDKNTYNKIRNFLLNGTKENHTKYENDEISHMCKQIRNKFNNKKIGIREIGNNSKIYKNQYSMIF